jgi:hypothetical protein
VLQEKPTDEKAVRHCDASWEMRTMAAFKDRTSAAKDVCKRNSSIKDRFFLCA